MCLLLMAFINRAGGSNRIDFLEVSYWITSKLFFRWGDFRNATGNLGNIVRGILKKSVTKYVYFQYEDVFSLFLGLNCLLNVLIKK